ncbi:MAG: ABC transporter ATP-binding protein [Planctomycetota bacterium]
MSAAVVAAVLIEVAGVVAPRYLRQFIDLLSGGSSATTVQALILILGIFALINFTGWIGQRVRFLAVTRLEAGVMADLYNKAFSYLLGHAHEFFISNFTGTLTRRVTRYARAFEQVFDNFIFNFFSTFLFAAGVIGVLSLRSIFLGLGLLVWTVIFVYAQFRMMQKLVPLRATRTEADSEVTGALSDAVTNHTTITAFAAVPYESTRFGDVVARWYAATKRVWDADGWIYGVQGLFAIGIEFALLAGAVLLWQRGFVTVGDFVLIQVYILGLMNHIWNIGNNMRQLYDAFSEATEMLDIFEMPYAILDRTGARPLQVTKGAIIFDDVCFEYRDSQREVLRNFTLAIQPHEKIALIGSSGAGKSTVAKLLPRLYEVSSGSISIDNQNISEVTQGSLRSSISFVPQEPILFHRSLMDNIRYGLQDATDAEVIEAAKQAHCYEFISRYPDGFATMTGERGIKLSGGERQRIAIARAILKNAPILILDEATSSLDSESERLIQETLATLMKGKTVIAIAHRLSTVMSMDRLVVMEEGIVTLSGTHDELLAQESNLYKKLWEIQAGGFISAN